MLYTFVSIYSKTSFKKKHKGGKNTSNQSSVCNQHYAECTNSETPPSKKVVPLHFHANFA